MNFNIEAGTPQEAAMNSTAPIQLLAGGYGWGKTALLCVKALGLCKDYPGCKGAILRNTRPNLELTIQAEFMNGVQQAGLKVCLLKEIES
jgi:hypothetical protein